MAVNCRVVPFAMLGLEGAMAREANTAWLTVSVVDADTLPDLALILVEPEATAVASPCEPAALLMVATLVDDELQVTEAVRSWVEPSE